ncbi:MAG: class I SAM-dependent methyltransferase [Candidatus Edwardsbacteria bacterium]
MAVLSSSLTVNEWHKQFVRQAKWTAPLRQHLYRKIGIAHFKKALEVGCGTGVITEELYSKIKGELIGIDCDEKMLEKARNLYPQIEFQKADAHSLPFSDGSFDLVYCHFTLLWLKDQGKGLKEMARVTKKGGVILAMAEPDYGGRIDYPEDLNIGELIVHSLCLEGADPKCGRRLCYLFKEAGFSSEIGVMTSLWDENQLKEEFESEWEFLFKTLNRVKSEKELKEYQRQEKIAIPRGERLVFLPIFYAIGRKVS